MNMELLKKEFVAKWKTIIGYDDVDAHYLDKPSDDQVELECPHGCQLEIHRAKETGTYWFETVEYPDVFRQTRFCREHGHARIYITTGLDAVGVGYDLGKQILN